MPSNSIIAKRLGISYDNYSCIKSRKTDFYLKIMSFDSNELSSIEKFEYYITQLRYKIALAYNENKTEFMRVYSKLLGLERSNFYRRLDSAVFTFDEPIKLQYRQIHFIETLWRAINEYK